jgi:hypothetical protein
MLHVEYLRSESFLRSLGGKVARENQMRKDNASSWQSGPHPAALLPPSPQGRRDKGKIFRPSPPIKITKLCIININQ